MMNKLKGYLWFSAKTIMAAYNKKKLQFNIAISVLAISLVIYLTV